MGAPKKEAKIAIEEMINLYKSGESLSSIAKLAHLSPVSIMKRLKAEDIVLRSNTSPRKLVGEEYLGSDGRYWVRGPQRKDGKARNRKRAQLVMEDLLGHSIPDEYSVHHIDEDYTNDDPSNLQLIPNSEHIPNMHNTNPSIIIRHYNNFNDAFMGINRDILSKPHKFITGLNTTMGTVKPLMIECKTTKCDKIDIGALGYKKQKWGHLVKTYIGGRIQEIKNLGVNIKGLSAGFDFNRKDTGNGSCIREILISRKKRGTPWDTITIVWRTSELQRRWAADLIFIHRIIELIPNSNFKRIQLYLNTAYQSAMYVIPLVKPVFKMDIDKLDPNNPYTKIIRVREGLYYKPEKSPHKLLSSAQKIVDLYKQYERGEKLPKITYLNCTLEGMK